MKTPRGSLMLIASLTALGLAPAPAGAAVGDAYYERTLMTTANVRCGLFTPAVSGALEASRRQARGAALRAGVSSATLDAVQRRAQLRAYSLTCGSPDVTTAAHRVRDAFEGYAKLWSMNFPGKDAGWAAFRARPTERAPEARWALSQRTAKGVTFGVVVDLEGGDLTAVFPDADAGKASGARLVMRDSLLARTAYLNPKVRGMAGRAPPRSVSRVWQASARGPAAEGLSEAGGQAFRFPATAITALEELDPRETVTLELVFPGRKGAEVTRRSLFEVGDFAAARAFLAAR